MPRAAFSHIVKAKAFERDKAVCCYRGGSVWVVDADGAIDWCEHRVPCSLGGGPELDNALTTCADCNHARGNRAAPPVLFFAGAITPQGLAYFGQLHESHAFHYRRMQRLHWTDWYLNRALCCVLWGAGRLNSHPGKYTRDDLYYARAALKFLTSWHRQLARQREIADPAERGLAPLRNDRTHGSFWDARRSTTIEELRAAMKKLAPNLDAFFPAPSGSFVPSCDDWESE